MNFIGENLELEEQAILLKNFNASISSSGSDLNVIYLSRKYQSKRLRLFLEFLIEHF